MVVLVLGILSLVFAVLGFFGLVFGPILGLILGIIALVMGRKLKATDQQAKIGWILGLIGLILSIISLIVAIVVAGLIFGTVSTIVNSLG